ncbi:hypothetical protein Bca52824_027104 [Brassica carinata]|uniref:Cyanate lyase C-terminal domain-containing protein n=1 Tax=Brassica carinata TaxID=52824 RepID=A0A8X7VAE9_BRACI|nr:hypothetical protein Bca52824_027104 [Brassica carinata]
MMSSPWRSYDPNLIQEPTIYRLNEAVMHFGENIKEIINEDFGDDPLSCLGTLDRILSKDVNRFSPHSCIMNIKGFANDK